MGLGKMPVERQFRSIPDGAFLDIDQALTFAHMGWSGALSWSDLLQSKRILIVAEAGAGKTYECRAQQERLWNAGEPAFFVELSLLSNGDLRATLLPEEEHRLDAWLKSQSDIATFFLDSIDELKLTLGSFEQALKQLAKAIRGQLGRARVVITTRPTSVDQHLIRKFLPTPAGAREEMTGDKFAAIVLGRARDNRTVAGPEPWRNVILLPLSDGQIRDMAAQQGVPDPNLLLDNINHRHAIDFARRPQDLIQICSDWLDHKRVRTHYDQIAYDVSVKLSPRTDRPEKAHISADRAFDGASRLALAALLTRKLTIRHSLDTEDTGMPEAALNPAVILSDWRPDERETLLARALFGFASYGRVRFHHRSVVEWLAASRLQTLNENGMPFRALKRLLLAETPQNKKIIRPSFRPVVAWLSLKNKLLFEEVRGREPDVLLNFGDPECLTPGQRSRALRAFVEQYRRGGWRGKRVPWLQVRRFASHDQSSEVKKLWDNGIENTEVRELLLRLIEAGRMADCSDIAFTVANQRDAPEIERLLALDALVALSDDRLRQISVSIESDLSLWPDELALSAIIRLLPKHLHAERFCRVVGRLRPASESAGDISWQLPQTVAKNRFSADELEALRAGLTDLLIGSAEWSESKQNIISGQSHVAPGLAEVCLRQMKSSANFFELAKSIVASIRFRHREHIEDDYSKSLKSAIAKASEDERQLIFWADDALFESIHPARDQWHRFFQLNRGSVLELDVVKDSRWINAALADRNHSEATRTVLFEIASQLWNQEGVWLDHVRSLYPLVSDIPKLISIIELRFQAGLKSIELLRMEDEHEKHKQERRKRDTEAHESWVAFWREVSNNVEGVFNVTREVDTAWNLWRAMEQTGDQSRSSGWNRRFIEDNFGNKVANKLRIALMKAWRSECPTLRSERPDNEKNHYHLKWQFGLAGIAAEAEDKSWASRLTSDEASLASRYAPIQLNGFPAWLEDLAAFYPNSVDLTLGVELSSELDEALMSGQSSMTLQNVSCSPETVGGLFIPRLLLAAEKCLGRSDFNIGANFGALAQIVDTVLKFGEADVCSQVVAFSRRGLKKNSTGSSTIVWLSALLRVVPEEGVDQLEAILDSLSSSDSAIAFTLFSSLFGERDPNAVHNLASKEFTPALLLRLVRLAYRHVRPADDVRRKGAFIPDLRDNAEHARNVIMTTLLNTKGSEGWLAKNEMANHELFAHFRDRAISLAEEQAAEETDNIAYSEEWVRSLESYNEAPPVTREEMFTLMSDRLDDIEDLLLCDSSPRAGWALIKEEVIMRQMVAGALESLSNHAYRVDQEAATADQKETDIRLLSTGSSQQAVIELKVGEKERSANDLLLALRDQLVRKYMAPENRRSGCFLITISSERFWQNPKTKAKLSFADLIALLNAEAQQIALNSGGSLSLIARGLDLRPRL